MPSTQLLIGGLRIRVSCSAEACSEGVAALIALFRRSDFTQEPDLHYSIAPDGRGAALFCNDEQLWRGDEAGEVVAAFEWALYSRTLQALYPPFLSLHAATVGWRGHGITIAGHSGAGKSSLCTAALLHGADYFSDEYSLLDAQGRITPYPRPLQWGGESHPAFCTQAMRDSGLFGEGRYAFTGRDGNRLISLLWLPKKLAVEPLDLNLLLLPRFDAKAREVVCEPVARSQALLELAGEMHHKLPIAERLRELHRRIPAHAAMYRVVFSDVHRAWERIEQLPTFR